jgi:hypothetical protein
MILPETLYNINSFKHCAGMGKSPAKETWLGDVADVFRKKKR